jgi:hypothetical protein
VKVQHLALLAIVLISCDTVLAQDDAGKKDLVKMQGVWRLSSGEEDGELVSQYAIENFKCVIKGDQLTFKGIKPLTDRARKSSPSPWTPPQPPGALI